MVYFLSLQLLDELLCTFPLTYNLSPFLLITFSILNSNNSSVVSCINKSAWCLLSIEYSRIIQDVSQWKTTSSSFINTWRFMSLLDNYQLKIVINIQIAISWYQIRMTPFQEVTQVPVRHIRQSHPVKTFEGSHMLNVFTEHLILNSWKASEFQRHCQISEKGPNKHSVQL